MKKSFAVLFCIFCLIWFFNYCTPLIFDDYVYSYIWHTDAMGVSLPDTAKRVSSLFDVFYSQYLHYFNWGGRSVAHTLAQFFLWQGKEIFNVANAVCFTILLVEIQWIIEEGKISFHFHKDDILWIFGTIWMFTVFMSDIFTWLTLSCNYLWTTVIVLAFLLVYEKHYLYPDSTFFKKKIILRTIFMFFFGIIVGWTNENVPCFIGLVLFYYVFRISKEKKVCPLLLSGLIGLIIGYLMLVLAPGNYVRYIRQLQDGIITPGIPMLKDNLIVLAECFFIRFFLIYYVVTRLALIGKMPLKENDKKTYNVSILFFIISLTSTVIMVFSPYFRFRSSFPGLVFLIISGGILRRIIKHNTECTLTKLQKTLDRLSYIIGSIYVVFTLVTSICVFLLQKQQTQTIMRQINDYNLSGSKEVLCVRERPLLIDRNLVFVMEITGGHAIYPLTITTDKDCWINKDVALYYGITAIQSVEEEKTE